MENCPFSVENLVENLWKTYQQLWKKIYSTIVLWKKWGVFPQVFHRQVIALILDISTFHNFFHIFHRPYYYYCLKRISYRELDQTSQQGRN